MSTHDVPSTTVGEAGTTAPPDRAARLSLLWVFALFNYLYCDVLGLFDPDVLQELMDGNVGGVEVTPTFLLGSGILMEIPIAMVLLSVVLPFAGSRWANVAAGSMMTVVQVSSLFVGSGPAVYYVFFSVIEIATTAFIVWYAWTWRQQQAS
jgi:Family of unknown function (DUF6326)